MIVRATHVASRFVAVALGLGLDVLPTWSPGMPFDLDLPNCSAASTSVWTS
ncbi:MAG: hypothetical protein QOF53_1930 [Nocardioidaceae bacterium]|jgi:hypothetical protein|nr:hypothetical protein [Nocardioidaceae bacterium]